MRLFICALWSPAGKRLTSWLSFVVSNCEFVTFPLVSSRLGMSVTTQSGSGRQYVGSGLQYVTGS